MRIRRKRMVAVSGILLVAVSGVTLMLIAFEKNLLYFYIPSQVVAGEAPSQRTFRVGGLVRKGSVRRDAQSLVVHFVLTDHGQDMAVSYDGVLPDLFREEQVIVADGRLLADGSFEAVQVLAKHDENYMPPEVADALGLKPNGPMQVPLRTTQ